MRQLVGYDRFEGERAYRQLAELYRAVRLYVNCFQPSMKLQFKQRTGARVQRRYDTAQTPFRWLVASGVLAAEVRERLEAIAEALDPVRLRRQIAVLPDALWHQAVFRSPSSTAATIPTEVGAVRFDIRAGGSTSDTRRDEIAMSPAAPVASPSDGQRQYRRGRKRAGPRTYRTRVDPFATAWPEIQAGLEVAPERTAKAIFQELQQRYPGRYPDVQLRTLQRRVQEWRARILVTFNDEWLSEELLAGAPCRGHCGRRWFPARRQRRTRPASCTGRWFWRADAEPGLLQSWTVPPCLCVRSARSGRHDASHRCLGSAERHALALAEPGW